MIDTPASSPVIAPEVGSGFGNRVQQLVEKERQSRVLTATQDWWVPEGIHWIDLEGAGPGGGGGSTMSATLPAGSGGGGQSVIGRIRVMPGTRLTYTHGVRGVKGAAGFGFTSDGADGTPSTLMGAGVCLVLLGGRGGKGDGTVGPAVGIAAVSVRGFQLFATSIGASGVVSGFGLAGGAVDAVPGGPMGTVGPASGGGGSTLLGIGAQGANANVGGTSPLDTHSGAGGSGSGVGNGSSNYGGGDGADGQLTIWWED